MAKNKKEPTPDPTLNFNGEDYSINEMDDDGKIILAHVTSLQRKMDSTKFNLDELAVGHAAYLQALSQNLNNGKEDSSEDEDIRVTASKKRAMPSPVPGGVAN